MSINYEKVKWNESPYKYANPSNLDQMDNGIKSACDSVDSLEPRASQTEKELWDIKVGKGGKNLNSYPYYLGTSTLNGVTFTDNGDGTITANGTATANAFFSCHTRAVGEKKDLIIPNGTYRIVGCPSGGTSMGYSVGAARTFNGAGQTLATDLGNGATFVANGDDYSDNEVNIQIQVVVRTGTTVNNLLFKPMLTTDLNATYDDYEPYTPFNVRDLGYASDDVKWLGWSVPKGMPMKNYTDANGVFHQRVGRIDMGTLSWVKGETSSSRPLQYFYVLNPTFGIKLPTTAMYCKAYTNGTTQTYSVDDVIWTNSSGIVAIDSSFSDATQFRNSLSGTYLYYELSSEVTMAEGKELIPKIGIDGLTFSVSGNTLSISNGTKTWTLT